MRTHSIDGHLPEFALQKAPIISALNSAFCLRLELSGRIIGSSVHRFIGSSVHRFIGSSVHRFIGSSVRYCALTPTAAITGYIILTA
ncbi:hypothetical protein [Roseobacter sp. HKCCD7924]|uniref:hypothetical protein n=1 Tax=Roseobacter sp. HKCCD7924 TaxID=2690530 RepID=UPI001C12F966|nr:hypothetical protein [Roseobacter sp. HKCCD7924]